MCPIHLGKTALSLPSTWPRRVRGWVWALQYALGLLPEILVKAMVFPVVMYGCEGWTVKKTSAKELMVLNCGVGEDS